jgi:hypothetical protein
MQLILRHATMSGQDKGPPSMPLAIRNVDTIVLDKITGHEISQEDEATVDYREERTYTPSDAIPTESWALVSEVAGDFPYGASAISGKVPVYSVLTSVFQMDFVVTTKRNL